MPKPVLSRQEYQSIIDDFTVELNHFTRNITEEELQALPAFNKEFNGVRELDSYVNDLRDPSQMPSQLLYMAFAYVDEYLNADPKFMESAYEQYLLRQRRLAEKKADA